MVRAVLPAYATGESGEGTSLFGYGRGGGATGWDARQSMVVPSLKSVFNTNKYFYFQPIYPYEHTVSSGVSSKSKAAARV